MADPKLSPIRDAATVIVLRDGDRGVEVLLLKRHSNSGFFGDAYAFPGGRLDPEDGREAYWADVAVATVQRCAALPPTPGRSLSRREALGLWVAAIRELFEEAGLLVACGLDGGQWTAPDPALLVEARAMVHSGQRLFEDVLMRLGARLEPVRLGYWAHWITPSVEGKRYDTRFFITAHPEGQVARRDDVETTDQVWLPPTDVLTRHRDGQMALPPPTLHVIDELDRLFVGQGTAMLPSLLAEREVVPLMPRVGAPDGDPAIVLPWDPAFEEAQGERLPGDYDYGPSYSNSPSRVVLRDGLWRLGRAT